MRRYPIFNNFSGGLSDAAPDDMLDNELIEAQNAVPDVERGSISKCRGTVRVNDKPYAEGPAKMLIEFGREDGSVEYLAFHEDGTVRTWKTNKKAAEIGTGDDGMVKVMVYDAEEDESIEVNADLTETRELKTEYDSENKIITVNLCVKGEDLPVVDLGGGRLIVKEKDPAQTGGGYSAKVVKAEGNDAEMSISVEDKLLTITLGTDEEGELDDSRNTIPDIAKEINGRDEFIAVALADDSLTQTEAQKNFRDGRAEAVIGSGKVTITANDAGTDGNDLTVEVKIAAGKNKALTAQLTETDLVVTLGTTSTGAVSSTKNTAAKVTAAINAIAKKPFIAEATDSGSLSSAEAKKNFTGGRNCLDDEANKAWKVAEAIKESAEHVAATFKGTGEGPLQRAEEQKTFASVDEIIKSDLPGVPVDYDVYNDVLYWLDGNSFWRYDGGYIKEVEKHEDGSETLWPYVKKCRFIEQRGQRHFFARPDSNEIYFSEVGEPNHIKTNNRITAVTDDSDLITGLREFGGALLVFKRRSIYAWYGWDPDPLEGDVRFDRLNVHCGAISQWTICHAEGYLIYLSEDGVYGLHTPYPNQLATLPLSDKKIGNVIRSAQNMHLACARYHNKAYRLSLCTDGNTNNVEYRYYPSISAWFGPFTHPVGYYMQSIIADLYTAHPTKGLIFKHEQGYNYDGEAIHFSIKTRPIDILKGMVLKSRVTRAYFAFRQFEGLDETSVNTVTIKVDYREQKEVVNIVDSGESFIFGKSELGNTLFGWIDLVVKEIRMWLKGRRVQVTVENNREGEPVTLYGFAFGVVPMAPEGSRFKVEEVA